MVSLKLKLSFSPLYLLSSMYIFTRFINSLPKPWLGKMGCINKIGCVDEMGYINKIDCINRIGCVGKMGYRVSEVEVGVLIVIRKIGFLVVLVLILILAKLFLKR